MLTRRQRLQLRQDATRDEPNRLRRAMQLAKITQEQLEAQTGVSQSTISKIANGQLSRLPLKQAQTFAQFFGCATDELFPAREAVAS
jgi:transcriptional regulator with XRE-family HTH domain